MTASSVNPPTLNPIKVVPQTDNQNVHQPNSSALVTTGPSFSAFLTSLTKDSFKQVVTGVEDKLKVVNQTLSMLLDTQGFDNILNDMLSAITLKTGELLGADRTTIFLLDEDRNELWSIVAKDEKGSTLELRIPADKGIAGEVATQKRVVNIPFDFYDDPRSAFAQLSDRKNDYRTYTMLALPLLSETGELVAVVQLLNKLKFPNNPDAPLENRIDFIGFTQDDEAVFEEFAPSIRLILESSRAFYMATQKQKAAEALTKATLALSQGTLDLEDTLTRVMNEAKELMNADRSTLWLIDRDRHDLWTKILQADGSWREMRVPMGVGFVGTVAISGKVLNIGFDLYDHADSTNSKKFDQATGYRTCSLLCTPIFNANKELIGVTQLVNKKKKGEFEPYNPDDWPKAPECWRASFDHSDINFMEVFNIQAGVALQNAKLFATVKQQEQMQRDILRSLSNGVISTDPTGHIIAANESAKRLLGLEESERLEGRLVEELVRIKDKEEADNNKFSQWFQIAIAAEETKNRQQYYPDQILQSVGAEQHSVNLSINTIADAAIESKVNGALVVMEDISDEKRLKTTMYRYMNQDLAEQLINSGGEAKLGGDLKEVSILFSDIRGYTTLTERMEPEEVVKMLNEYFEDMVEALFKYKGTLDKYIGDAMMAVFGSPLPLDEHQWMAVQTAVEMRHRLAQFNERRTADNQIPIKIGIGINSDKVLSGNIGSSKRMEFTAIGDGVNLGSRLEGASKQYGCDVVISETIFNPCADRIWYRELDWIRVKGKNDPVKLYELVGLRSDPISDQQQQIIESYHKGREHYLNRKFAKAVAEFAEVLELDSHNMAASQHMKRCQHFLLNQPPDDWDGVWALTEK